MMQRLPLHTYDQDPMAILMQEPWLRDELREHCCLCRQWTAKRGGTKLHMQTLHTAEWEQTADLARAQCLQYRHLVTHTSGCSFCLEPKFADKRAAMAHTQNCQVLFQLMMLTIMRGEEVGLPDGLNLGTTTLSTGQKIRLLAAPQSRNLTSAQCSYLAKHCVVCKQYMPDPVSLKQHIRRKHPEIPIEETLLIPQCKLLVKVAAGKCLLCDRTVKKASGHTTTCLVGFQTCLSRHLLENVGAASRVRPPVPRPRADGHEQGRESQQTIQAGSRGTAGDKTQGQREGQEWKGTEQREVRRMECLLGYTECGPGQHGLRSGATLPAAGRGAHGTTSREGVPASHDHLTVWDPETAQASVEWNNQRDTGTVTSNLRTCLFRLMVQELMARLDKLQGTPQSISEAIRAQWVTDNPLKWLYHRWNPALTKLEVDPTQAGLPQDRLISLLEGMDAALKQDSTVLCQFKALRPLSEEMRGESVAFKISVALRGPAAATLHQGFAALDGCMALQLIGANLHRERQRPCKEANLVRECVFGRPSSGPSFLIRRVPMPATLTPPSCLYFTLVTQCRILMCCWGVWLLSGRLYNRVADPSSCVT